ncbi:unnamed protein product, partial [Acanthoscelides obtectus]
RKNINGSISSGWIHTSKAYKSNLIVFIKRSQRPLVYRTFIFALSLDLFVTAIRWLLRVTTRIWTTCLENEEFKKWGINMNKVKTEYLRVGNGAEDPEIHTEKCILKLGPPHSNDTFDDMLPAILAEYDDIILAGDINVNLLLVCNNLTKCIDSYNLKQVISEPTRITESTHTLS